MVLEANFDIIPYGWKPPSLTNKKLHKIISSFKYRIVFFFKLSNCWSRKNSHSIAHQKEVGTNLIAWIWSCRFGFYGKDIFLLSSFPGTFFKWLSNGNLFGQQTLLSRICIILAIYIRGNCTFFINIIWR